LRGKNETGDIGPIDHAKAVKAQNVAARTARKFYAVQLRNLRQDRLAIAPAPVAVAVHKNKPAAAPLIRKHAAAAIAGVFLDDDTAATPHGFGARQKQAGAQILHRLVNAPAVQ